MFSEAAWLQDTALQGWGPWRCRDQMQPALYGNMLRLRATCFAKEQGTQVCQNIQRGQQSSLKASFNLTKSTFRCRIRRCSCHGSEPGVVCNPLTLAGVCSAPSLRPTSKAHWRTRSGSY